MVKPFSALYCSATNIHQSIIFLSSLSLASHSLLIDKWFIPPLVLSASSVHYSQKIRFSITVA